MDKEFQHKKIDIVYKDIKSLKGAKYNPRKISKKQYEDIKESLMSLDMVIPIVVNINHKRMNRIIGGHQRVAVAKELGMKEVPCILVNYTEKKEKEANIRFNKSGGEWDWEKLDDFFDIDDLLDLGFTKKDFFDKEKVSFTVNKNKKHECPECGHKF